LASGDLGLSSVLLAADPKMPPPGRLAGALLPLDEPEPPGTGEVGRCAPEPPGTGEVGRGAPEPEEDEPDDGDDDPPPNGFGRGAFEDALEPEPDDGLLLNGLLGRGGLDPELDDEPPPLNVELLPGRENGLPDDGLDSTGSPLASRSS
jgi:hypothetical protein